MPNKYGHRVLCRCSDICADEARRYKNESNRKSYAKNPHAFKMRSRRWHASNRDRKLNQQRSWYERNRDYKDEYIRQWKASKGTAAPSGVLKNHRWTPAEITVALDVRLTTTEAAMILGRTRDAVVSTRQRYKLA